MQFGILDWILEQKKKMSFFLVTSGKIGAIQIKSVHNSTFGMLILWF